MPHESLSTLPEGCPPPPKAQAPLSTHRFYRFAFADPPTLADDFTSLRDQNPGKL